MCGEGWSGRETKTEQAIQGLIRSVRRRWRLRLALRGLAWTVGLTLAVAFLSSLALERLRFAADAVTWARVLTWGNDGRSLLFFFE